jgi:dCMP deaminase
MIVMGRQGEKLKVMMELAQSWAKLGTCCKLGVGCVIFTPDFYVVSSGFNGAPSGVEHCKDVGCMVHKDKCVRSCHAEVNAVAHAARRGIALEGTLAAVTHHPCPACLTTMMQAGVRKIWYGELTKLEYREMADKLTARAKALGKFDGILSLQ